MTSNPDNHSGMAGSVGVSVDNNLPDRALVYSWVLVSDFGSYVSVLSQRCNDIPKDADAGIGYVYIDHDCGISLSVERLCTIRSLADPIASNQLLDNVVSLKFRYSALKTLNFLQLSAEKVQDLGLPIAPDWLKFYETPDIASIRGLAWLDPFRAPGFFDDVIAVLPGIGGNVPEMIWIRLKRYFKDTDRFHGILLNEPFRDYGIHRNDLIEVQVARNSDGITLIAIPSKVSRETATDSNSPGNPPEPEGFL